LHGAFRTPIVLAAAPDSPPDAALPSIGNWGPIIMKLDLPRTALSCWVLLGLTAGCAPSTARTEPVAQPTVTSEDVARNPGESIEKTLQAKVPGVLITRTADGSIALQIRGTSSFSGNTAPLYVIDGSPTEAGPGGALQGVSPYDIDTIKVLKDPAETALYGMRGANGVIIVTTKRPGKRQ
jgi:TonB-dependent SusC/RagA subfamily outer membrane receptor